MNGGLIITHFSSRVLVVYVLWGGEGRGRGSACECRIKVFLIVSMALGGFRASTVPSFLGKVRIPQEPVPQLRRPALHFWGHPFFQVLFFL